MYAIYTISRTTTLYTSNLALQASHLIHGPSIFVVGLREKVNHVDCSVPKNKPRETPVTNRVSSYRRGWLLNILVDSNNARQYWREPAVHLLEDRFASRSDKR